MSAAPQRITPADPAAPIVLLVPDDRGLLHLLHAIYVPAARHHRWSGLATGGLRRLLVQGGTFVAGEGEQPAERLVACATGPHAIPASAHNDGADHGLLHDPETWAEVPAHRRDAFLAVCGAATPVLARAGRDPSLVEQFDRRFGADAVDRLLGRHPALSGLLTWFPNLERVPERAADAATLLDPASTPDAFAAAAWRLSGPALSVMLHHRDGKPPTEPIAPVPEAGALRRFLRGLEGSRAEPDATLRALRLLGLAHRDWTPDDPEAIAGMGVVLEAMLRLARAAGGALDPDALLAPVRGDWARAAHALVRHDPDAGARPEAWAAGVADMAAAFQSQVLEPAAAYARAATGEAPSSRPGRDEAWKALFSGKGIVAVAEASAQWHVRGAAMTEVIAALGGLSRDRWPRPFPDFVASNGHSVVPLLSTAELVEEGRTLGHCVGSYARGCLNGSYVIASVRGPDGTRGSTVQVEPPNRIVQHSGGRNGTPDPADALAVREFAAALGALPSRRRRTPVEGVLGIWKSAARRIRDGAAPRWLREGGYPYNPCDPLRVLRAASLWERHLPRPARGSIPALLDGPAPDLAARLAKLGPPRPVGRPIDLVRSTLSATFPAVRRAGFVCFVTGGVLGGGYAIVQSLPEPRPERTTTAAQDEENLLATVRRGVLALGQIEAGTKRPPPGTASDLLATISRINDRLPRTVRIPDLRLAIAAQAEVARRAAAIEADVRRWSAREGAVGPSPPSDPDAGAAKP